MEVPKGPNVPSQSQSAKRMAQNVPEKRELQVSGAHTMPATQNEKKGFWKSLIANGAKETGKHVLNNIIIPSAQKFAVDLVTGAVTTMFGQGGSTPTSYYNRSAYSGYYTGTNYSYSQPAQQTNYSQPTQPQNQAPRGNAMYFDNIIFPDRGNAEVVKKTMINAVQMYNMASVADMYEFAKVKCNNPQATKYGWYDLSPADIQVVQIYSGEWEMRMPPAIPIDS